MNAPVSGWADPAFASCLEAFRANFAEGGELGAACAISVDGRLVLDAWGGTAIATSGEPWHRNTVVPVFSVTKGVAALCVLAQVERGALDLDRPVARYWREFGNHGKDLVSIREALGHRAGVPMLGGNVTLDDLADPKTMSSRLAAEPPLFTPGTAHSYHALTIGWITTELVRRSTGQQIGQWFREHLAEPRSLNIQIGRSAADRSPIARVEVSEERDTPPLDPLSFPGAAISLNGLIVPRMSGLAAAMNDPALQRVELAGANSLANARSLAGLYAATVSDRGEGRLLSPDTIADACRIVSEGEQWGMKMTGPTWGAGLMLPWAVQPMLGQGSFGHDGAGGSLAFAHAPSGVGFAYVRNRVGAPGIVDPFVSRVLEALAARLGITVHSY